MESFVYRKRLKERGSDKTDLGHLLQAQERVIQGAERLKGKEITLKLPEDPTPDNIAAYIIGLEEELSKLGILTVARGSSVFPSYGFYPDVMNYIGWQKRMGQELSRREYFYDLISERGRGYDPAGRKVSVQRSEKKNSEALIDVIEACGGEIVGPVGEADTAVYLGERFCDTDSTGYRPLYDIILPWVKDDKSKTALIFYSATDGLCGPHEEPELDTLRRLATERENVSFIALGDWCSGKRFFT